MSRGLGDVYKRQVYVDSSGNVYVADSNNNRVQKWEPNATAGTTIAGGNGTTDICNNLSQLYEPLKVYVDDEKSLYVLDKFGRVVKWLEGAEEGYIYAGRKCSSGESIQRLSWGAPDFAFDRHKNVYVADRENHRIVKWSKAKSTDTITSVPELIAGKLSRCLLYTSPSPRDTG